MEYLGLLVRHSIDPDAYMSATHTSYIQAHIRTDFLVDVGQSQYPKLHQSWRNVLMVNLSTDTEPVHATQTARYLIYPLNLLLFLSQCVSYLSIQYFPSRFNRDLPGYIFKYGQSMLQSSRIKWKEYKVIFKRPSDLTSIAVSVTKWSDFRQQQKAPLPNTLVERRVTFIH